MKKYVRYGALLVLVCLSTSMFQNCTRIQYTPQDTDLSLLAASSVTILNGNVSTKKNTAITFQLALSDGSQQGLLSFAKNPGITLIQTSNGTFNILNATTFQVEYTPDTEFVGSDQTQVYVTDTYGNFISGQITVTVGNILNVIQPALAVRGLSCITCHSEVASNIVTDYGYGNSWYFDQTSDSFYSDRMGAQTGLASLNLTNSSQIFVPAAQVPAAIQSQFTNVNTLADFVRARFAQGSPNLASQVTEVSQIKINLPTSARIQSVFGNPTSVQVYQPDTRNSPALQGLTYDTANNLFIINNMVCDGDLYLGATVYIQNATIQSLNGCRIYSTGSIFIDGAMTSAGYQNSANHNIQLLSAVSIWMGVGNLFKNGAFCEVDANNNPTGWYSSSGNTENTDCTNSTNAVSPFCNSFDNRLTAIESRNTYSRIAMDVGSVRSLFNVQSYQPSLGYPNGSIYKEEQSIETHLGGPLYDAACGPQSRAVTLNRVLLAAPYVNSRYNGDFSGAIVSEAALMSLGTFTFQFDPIFKSVSIFSMLESNELISLTP